MAKEQRKKIQKNIIIGIILLIVIIGVIFFYSKNLIKDEMTTGEFILPETTISKDLSEFSAIKTIEDSEIKTRDGTRFIIDPNEIRGGGPSKGGIGFDRGIPALDENNIKYVSVKDADKWIEDNELVLALIHKGKKRVYPLQILVWHEIVNDVVSGDPILITYCPLCGSGIAYYRVINGKAVKFGTSGKLYSSNLVMYDDLTDTYWQQIDGNAITGELTGYELKEISIDTVVWRDVKKYHPDSEILSQETGISRNYGRDPYGSYYEDSFLIFPVNNEDNRVHPKTVIFGIEVNGNYKAYKEDDLIKLKIINDEVNSVKIKIERDEAGIVKIINLKTEEEIVKERVFWFSWYAFHPETELYDSEKDR